MPTSTRLPLGCHRCKAGRTLHPPKMIWRVATLHGPAAAAFTRYFFGKSRTTTVAGCRYGRSNQGHQLLLGRSCWPVHCWPVHLLPALADQVNNT